MNIQNISSTYSATQEAAGFMRRVYNWMTGGVLLTALVATYLGTNPEMMMSIMGTPILFYGLMFAQLGMVITLSAAITRMRASTAIWIFLIYAILTGVTFSTLFMVYARDTIAGVFFATASGFAGLSLIGYTTKRDLGPIGSFCGMALFGLIGWAILSWIFPSLMGGSAQFAYSVIGVGIFAGLTAYDTQRLKQLRFSLPSSGGDAAEVQSKAAIMGALALYLDFINLFLLLLRLFGGGGRRR